MKIRREIVELVIFAAMVATAVTNGQDKYWSFRPVRRVPLPEVVTPGRPRNPVDFWIEARLLSDGLTPAAPADRITLIRRVTIDLIGLPPTPDEIDTFVADERPGAYERLVDRLLASPHYGERWARPWLDLCHYGDSDGHLTDQLRPVAWRYRDWVTRALNENMPFDDFTIAQLAGDILSSNENCKEASDGSFPSALSERFLGTGFLRQTLSNREGGADLEEYRVEQIVDRTSMVGTIWLGLTVGCARCHDHKYDPLSQEEFFKFYAFFDRADEVNIDAPLASERTAYVESRPKYERERTELVAPFLAGITELQRKWEAKCLHAASHPGEDHVWDRQWELLGLVWGGGLGEGQLEGTEIVKRAWDQRTARQQSDLLDYFLQHGSIIDEKRFQELKLGQLREQLTVLKKKYPHAHPTRAPVMQVSFSKRETYVHESGDFQSRGSVVGPGTPSWLPGVHEKTDAPLSRLDLARWLISLENPLTARVTVNRMWQEFFGRGLVLTSNDFGLRGNKPSHPELLDWLAGEFMNSGWDVKYIHRLIVTSATYQQSSRPRPELATIDPENVLVSRQNSLRVPAEAVRDFGLAASGLLNEKVGGASVYPPQNERVTMEAFGSNPWKASEGADRYRRGLYTFVLRTSPFAQAIIFDAPNPQLSCSRRDRSNTPLQALTLLNDPVFGEMAMALATRITQPKDLSDEDRIRLAWRICLGRAATGDEVTRLHAYLTQQRKTDSPGNSPPFDPAWIQVASVLLNLHEFITRD